MSVPLVRRNLTSSPSRLAGALIGVGLAVALVFTQIGFLNAMLDSTVRIITRFDGELVMIASGRQSLVTPVSFPRARLAQAGTVEGVAEVRPLSVLPGLTWQQADREPRPQPAAASTGLPLRTETSPKPDASHITLLLIDPRRPAIRAGLSARSSAATTPGSASATTAQADSDDAAWTQPIRLPDTVLFDSLSGAKVPRVAIGRDGDLAGHRVRVVGAQPLGGNLFTGGYFVASQRTGGTVLGPLGGGGELPNVDFGIIRLDDPGQAEEVCRRLNALLPGDVRVLPKESPWYAPWPATIAGKLHPDWAIGESYARSERWFWLTNTPIGFVFSLGVLVGVVVATVIVFQILQSDISRHLSEYATLKAMGYPNRFLARIVRTEAVWLAIGGFLPGTALSAALYWWISDVTGLPLDLSVARLLVVFILTVLACLIAARLAVGKLYKASPAELF